MNESNHKTNRLALEKSPYLRQHATNPVDWYPWGSEALEKARKENKPILLSVGYSSCHWCHVMAHESFEDAAVAAVMNENFINIKVDREERPDLDQIYQSVAQLMTGGGGWPLTVFLTPELKPFFGGTYFPVRDSYGRPGWRRLLETLSNAFTQDKELVSRQTNQISLSLQKQEQSHRAPRESIRPGPKEFDDITKRILSQIDTENGGLKGAPKFPHTFQLSYLWRHGTEEGKAAVIHSLSKMARGGIYDQLGGGFHRYSTDETWTVPHFEKMLYDNALLLRLYSEVCLTDFGSVIDGSTRLLFEKVIHQTVEYVLREMTSPHHGFWSAQDADTEGEEGKSFVWEESEVRQILPTEFVEKFVKLYGITSHGNFESRQNIFVKTSTNESDYHSAEILRCRSMLLNVREKRVQPGLDDKVLASWNGLMISGLTWASQALERSGELTLARNAHDAATRAFEFAVQAFSRPGNRLWSVTTSDGKESRFNAYLDDYAFLSQAAIELARFDDSSKQDYYLDHATRWMQIVRKHFSDPTSGGYYFTSDDHEQLIERPRTLYDQAIPAGTAVALACLAATSHLRPDDPLSASFEEEFQSQIARLFPLAMENPFARGELCCSALYSWRGFIDTGLNVASPFVWNLGPKSQVCYEKTCRQFPTEQAANEFVVSSLQNQFLR